jgi:hypothetical protein
VGPRVMGDSIPAVLAQLAQSGVSVRWRDGKAVFGARAEPPADVVALIDARKVEVSAFLHPEAVQRRLRAETAVLQAERPPDVSDDRWETALTGLRAFIAAGHGDEALRLGWQRDELYRVPQMWSQIHICGAALLIGDREVADIAPNAIQIRIASGATLAFYRKPEIDIGLVYSERFKILSRNVDAAEADARSYDYAISVHRSHCGSDLAAAKRAVIAAIKKRSATK